jgi:hypothetical protein
MGSFGPGGGVLIPRLPSQEDLKYWYVDYDGPIDEWTDKVAVPLASPKSVGVPVLECNNVNTRIRTFKKWDGVSVLDFTTYCYPTTFANVGYLISDRLSSTARNLAIAVLNSSGTLSLQVQTSTGFQSVSGPALSLNTTHEVKATIDTATGIANMWLDNALVIDSHTFTGVFSVANEFIAGGQWPAGSSSFGGYIWGSKLVNHFDYTLSEAFGDYVSDIQRRTGNHATISQKLTLHPYVDDVAKEVVHPDIYIFDEPWNGWTHWMVYTPYASNDNQIENPSIEVSNDGITWQTPAGLTNPIVGTPVGASDFNSDPELMFDDGKLKIIYREALISTSIENMKYTESSDGIKWYAHTTIFSNAFATERPVSHTIAWNGSEWFMLYWDLVTTNFRYRTSSALDTGWSSSSPCVLTNVTTNPWHQKMRYINNEYVMYSQLGGSGGGELVLIKSTDGINWDYSTATTLIRSTNSELARNAYRSTFWPSDETGITYRSWFGEANNPWGIYYGVYGELGNFGRVENGSWGTLDGIEDKSRSNGYSVVRDGSGDAIGPFVPPLDGELIDSQGLPIGVHGSEDKGYVHNGSPASVLMTDPAALDSIIVSGTGTAADGEKLPYSALANGKGSWTKDISGFTALMQWTGTQWSFTYNAYSDTSSTDSTHPPTLASAWTGTTTVGYNHNPWVDETTYEFKPRSYADYLAHALGLGGDYLQWKKDDGTAQQCVVVENAGYGGMKEYTDAEENLLIRWSERYTSECGAGILITDENYEPLTDENDEPITLN